MSSGNCTCATEAYDECSYCKLVEENARLRTALEKAAQYLGGGIMSSRQYVKQLDGTIKMESVPNYRSKVYEEARAALGKGDKK
jgi:hypothetical protein